MKIITDYVESMHSGWLASSFACCFPALPDQSELERPGESRKTSLTLHILIQLKLLVTRRVYVASNLDRLMLLQPKAKNFTLLLDIFIGHHNGLQMDGVSLQGLQVGQF